MLTTITLGSRISVQGEFIDRLPGGEVLVRDGNKVYRGRPVAWADDKPADAPRAA
jgi:hypothetical protein